MASSTPSGAPSSKEKKYDRQLRLWGANGQNKLENAHIALFNASATGCEILKNLILPCNPPKPHQVDRTNFIDLGGYM